MALYKPDQPQPPLNGVYFHDQNDEVRVIWRPIDWLLGCGLIGWLATYFGAGYLAVIVQMELAQGRPEDFLGFAAWVTGGFVSGLMVIACFCWTEVLVLNEYGLCYEWRVIALLGRRWIPLQELQGAALEEVCEPAGDDVQVSRFVTFLTRGEWVRAARAMDERQQEWLVAVINDGIRRFKKQVSQDLNMLMNVQGHWRLPASGRASLPWDSPLQLQQEIDWLEVSWRGRFSLGTFVCVVILNVFWNGVVVALTWQALRHFQLITFAFLMPFSCVGMLILAVLIGVLSAPLSKRIFRFEKSRIIAKIAFCGIGWSNSYEYSDVNGIELRRVFKGGYFELYTFGLSRKGARFALSFLDKEGQEVMHVSHITEGEARVVGDILLKMGAAGGTF